MEWCWCRETVHDRRIRYNIYGKPWNVDDTDDISLPVAYSEYEMKVLSEASRADDGIEFSELRITNDVGTLVYKDLWKRGFIVTEGSKFGADFLLYKSNPSTSHAVAMVALCNSANTMSQFLYGRMANVINKVAIFVKHHNREISYTTLLYDKVDKSYTEQDGINL